MRHTTFVFQVNIKCPAQLRGAFLKGGAVVKGNRPALYIIVP